MKKGCKTLLHMIEPIKLKCLGSLYANGVYLRTIAIGMVLYKEQQDRAVRAVTNAAATIRGLWLQAVSGWQTREQATVILRVHRLPAYTGVLVKNLRSTRLASSQHR